MHPLTLAGCRFNEWYKPNSRLEFPRGGSQAMVQALVRWAGTGSREACACAIPPWQCYEERQGMATSLEESERVGGGAQFSPCCVQGAGEAWRPLDAERPRGAGGGVWGPHNRLGC